MSGVIAEGPWKFNTITINYSQCIIYFFLHSKLQLCGPESKFCSFAPSLCQRLFLTPAAADLGPKARDKASGKHTSSEKERGRANRSVYLQCNVHNSDLCNTSKSIGSATSINQTCSIRLSENFKLTKLCNPQRKLLF